MEQKVINWVQCDNRIKEYNEIVKKIKEERDNIGETMISEVNSSELSKCKELVALSSIIGSANTSSTLEEISSEVISLSMRKPTIDLTLSISIEWSASSCLFTESPRTSLIPSPVFGVVSTRTMFEGTWNTCPLWGQ